jgi:hypothetical protein
VTRPESLKPQAATLPEASPEVGAAVPVTTLAPGADGESGEAESATAQMPRTARGRGEPARTAAAAPRTAKESPLPKAAFDAGRSRTGPVASKTSPSVAETPAPWTAPSTVTPSSEAVGPEASILTPITTAPAPERSELWMNPAPQPGTQEPGHDAPLEDEDSGHPPSRLSGLRNMLVSLGRRSLIEDEEGADEGDLKPRFERATVRPAYREPPTGEAEPAASAPAPVRVTAPPEFLPPKPAAEAEKEKEPLRPTPPVPRRERETPDEIQTLPSWRGQYRKKRYPPI